MLAQHSTGFDIGADLLSLIERKIGSASLSTVCVENGQGDAIHNRQRIESRGTGKKPHWLGRVYARHFGVLERQHHQPKTDET